MGEQCLLTFARLVAPSRVGCLVPAYPVVQTLVIGNQNLGGMQACQLGAQGLERELRHGELSGGDVGIGNRGRS